MELEATYALLTQAAATDHALRSRLRGSQALVWGDQALMLTRVAPEAIVQKPVSAPVDLRFKRRMEWEVSRRIARVDRELRDLPPGQRFWQRKKKSEHEQTARARIQADAAASKARRAKMADVVNGPTDQQKKVVRARKTTTPLRIQTGPSLDNSSVQSPLVDKGPRRKMSASDERISTIHKPSAKPKQSSQITGAKSLPVYESPVKSPLKLPKENQQPNEIKSTASVAEEEPTATDALSDKDAAALEHSSLESTAPKTEDVHGPVVSLELELEQEASHQEQPTQIFKMREDKNELSSQSSSQQSSPLGHSTTNQRRQQPWQNPYVSSLGRQVLSEFRTSGGPSFGLPPISASARGQPRQLNRDVLRRLFSDLDSDKDGHLNRIETCLALHRLQIVVPAAKIASFFRHIYDSSQSRDDYVEPWKEVISYAQFVAFVTAAHEKQQLDRQSKPVRRQRTSGVVRGSPQPELPPRGQPIRQYVVESNRDEESTANAVFEKIPDFLVGRILSEPTRSSVKVTSAVVRRSIEKFLPAQKIQDEDIIAIAQDLIKAHMKSSEIVQREIEEDTSGLLRAAAYFENVQLASDVDGIVSQDGIADADLHDQTEWLNKLTEEQVTCMVHELWKERQQPKVQDSETKILIENEPEEDHSEQFQNLKVEDQLNAGQILQEKATDMSDFEYVMHVNMVSEKAIQVECEADGNNSNDLVGRVQENSTDVLQSSPRAQELASRSNLTTAFLKFSEGKGIAPDLGDEKPLRVDSESHSHSSLSILQAMRQRRKQYQGNTTVSKNIICEPPTQCTPPASSNIAAPASEVVFDSFIREVQSRSSISISTDNHDTFNNLSETEDNDMDIQPSTEETPTLTQKLTAPVFLDRFQSHDSSASNNSDLSGASDIKGSVDLSPRLFSPLSFQPSGQGYYTRRSHTSSRSRDRDSILSEDLSEGEIEGSDLSDGEIYGFERKQLIRLKNRSPHILNDTSSNSENGTSVQSSIESGELLPINKVHRNYRHHLMTSSSSSIESGEFELGLMS